MFWKGYRSIREGKGKGKICTCCKMKKKANWAVRTKVKSASYTH